jgi:hypothetical protein
VGDAVEHARVVQKMLTEPFAGFHRLRAAARVIARSIAAARLR